ncbi:MAG TPA: helix-turn-helix domain-containing GNAT family N-acetyltransferase [Nocardioidaceae bacterium]|nr:helix-turn-helix domain-containing GNAT family N-acetyltransferase [Nocardioidaceae bacterium]
MATDQVAQVRRFNRLVTQRVGALDDHYLARDRPLGEARLLWEIGVDGCDVRTLRSRLALDSGYLSRLLRSLESAGLVTVGAGAHDKRVRTARLTPSGAAERAVLDRRSDELATSLLDPLDETQQGQLVASMATVSRLLTAGAMTYAVADPSTPPAQHCLREYFAELDRRFDVGFDPVRSTVPDAAAFVPPSGALVVASLWSEPLGCGGLLWQEDGSAYIKRMWIDPSARGLGIGRRLLSELEALAARHGCETVRLETNRSLTEAIGLYRSAGYVEVEPFNDEPYAHHWFAKRLRPA